PDAGRTVRRRGAVPRLTQSLLSSCHRHGVSRRGLGGHLPRAPRAERTRPTAPRPRGGGGLGAALGPVSLGRRRLAAGLRGRGGGGSCCCARSASSRSSGARRIPRLRRSSTGSTAGRCFG